MHPVAVLPWCQDNSLAARFELPAKFVCFQPIPSCEFLQAANRPPMNGTDRPRHTRTCCAVKDYAHENHSRSPGHVAGHLWLQEWTATHNGVLSGSE